MQQEEIYGLVFQASRVIEEASDSSTPSSSDKGQQHLSGDQHRTGAQPRRGFPALEQGPRVTVMPGTKSSFTNSVSLQDKQGTKKVKHREIKKTQENYISGRLWKKNTGILALPSCTQASGQPAQNL